MAFTGGKGQFSNSPNTVFIANSTGVCKIVGTQSLQLPCKHCPSNLRCYSMRPASLLTKQIRTVHLNSKPFLRALRSPSCKRVFVIFPSVKVSNVNETIEKKVGDNRCLRTAFKGRITA